MPALEFDLLDAALAHLEDSIPILPQQRQDEYAKRLKRLLHLREKLGITVPLTISECTARLENNEVRITRGDEPADLGDLYNGRPEMLPDAAQELGKQIADTLQLIRRAKR